jgi:hypothetical protein
MVQFHLKSSALALPARQRPVMRQNAGVNPANHEVKNVYPLENDRRQKAPVFG